MLEVMKNLLTNRKNAMLSCNHLFVKIGIDSNNQDIIECVHCGLTNKYLHMDDSMDYSELKKYGENIKDFININNAVFNRQYVVLQKMFGRVISFRPKNMISDEVLPSRNVSLLYEASKMVNPSASNEELFQIMKELYDLETDEEKSGEIDVVYIMDLLERYRDTHENSRIRR